jgi:alkylation response protein AidB-like acyl-CoA dehydrogenase
MAMPEMHNSQDLFESIEALTPLIQQNARTADRQKRLPEVVANALRDAGFFRMFRPQSRGGLGLDPVGEFKVAEALARVDAAAAWNVQISNSSEVFGGWFGDEASAEVFGVPDAIVTGAFNPHRRAVIVEGGYRVSGRTFFNSNCHSATWIIGPADVFDGDTMRVDADGQPETLLMAIPARDYEIVENWNTMGMGGTGSHDVNMSDVFVPAERAVPFGPLAEVSPAYDNPLSRMAIWAVIGSFSAVAIGVAQAAVDDLQALGTKVPAYTANAIQNRNGVQLRLARAEGKLAAARALFHSTYAEIWDAVKTRRQLEMAEKARCQLACSHAALTAAEVVDLVHSCVGTSGIREEQNFEKYFRDAHVITQHAFICEARLESVGQVMFGLEPDWGFFSF